MSEKEFGSSPADYVDPAWDYLTVFRTLLEIEGKVQTAIKFIGEQETATPQSHADLAMRVEEIATKLRLIEEGLK